MSENTKLITPVNYLNHAVKSNTGTPLFEIYRTDGVYIDKIINDITQENFEDFLAAKDFNL